MKWDNALIGVIVTIVLALIGFGFWLGHLESKIDAVGKNAAIDAQVNDALAKIKTASDNATVRISQPSSVTVEVVLNTVICNFDNPGCVFEVSNTQIVERSFPVETHKKKVIAAWYVPVDAINFLSAFDDIQALPGADGVSVVVKAKGVPGARGQVRIQVYGVLA